MTKREALARAVREAFALSDPLGLVHRGMPPVLPDNIVDALLAELREPDEGMLEVAKATDAIEGLCATDAELIIWQAMLDKAGER